MANNFDLNKLLNPFAPQAEKFGPQDLLVPAMEEDPVETSPLIQEIARQRATTTPTPDFADVNNPMIQQEMSRAQEIEQESKDLENQMIQSEVQQTQPSRLDMYRDLLSKAQKDRRDNLLTANLLMGGNQIAQGFATQSGARIGAGEQAVQALRDQAGLGLQELTENQKNELTSLEVTNEAELNDPNSDISKFAREQAIGFATRLGMGTEALRGLEKMSAKQLERLGFRNFGAFLNKTPQQSDYETIQGQPLSYNPLTNSYTNILTGEPYTGEVRRKIISQFVDPNTGNVMLRDRTRVMPLDGKPSVEEKAKQAPEVTRRDLNPKQKDLLDETRKALTADPRYKNSQEAVDGADSALTLLQAGKDSGEDLVRAVQTMLAKSSGQVGVLTEQDVSGFNGRADVISRLGRVISVAAKGKLPEEDRKFLMNYAKTMQKAARRNMLEATSVYETQLSQDLGVEPKQASGLLNIKERVEPQAEEMVKVISPEGKPGKIPKSKLKAALKKGFKEAK